ncbi:MAG: hypothetical protein JRJ03_09065 [Deltaproteobacteria bacterium]|nr:hypothetical protein [Deltaproteobacteria bacterium]
MCAPISVTTGGTIAGCNGICAALPSIMASLSLLGVLILNFKTLLGKFLPFKPRLMNS